MINADTSKRALVRSASLSWQESPSKKVLRKRFHLAGEAESGQVTSLVKYLPGSTFPAHGHPEGEEILVLEGVFTDDQGDWPKGAWLLNPEGFSHAPSSAGGCLLFVKLRQYTGSCQKAVKIDELAWHEEGDIRYRILHEEGVERTRIIDLPAGAAMRPPNDRGSEGLVLRGNMRVWGEALAVHDWFRAPAKEKLIIESDGCSFYLKENAVAGLWTRI